MSEANIHIERLPDGTTFEMIKVEGGPFMMGSEQGSSWERPVHEVSVKDFWIGKFPVTQDLWESVMGENPFYFKGYSFPVEQVSWNDTQQFLEKLNQLTACNYRLPSEAEWEYAARGGNQSKGFNFAGGNKLKEVAWYYANSHSEAKPVGLKQPNELGFYDMSGNVQEWCADHWHENYENAPKEGRVWIAGANENLCLVRGGSWISNDDDCTVSNRGWYYSDVRRNYIGFRIARY
jgi:formylglycine-generating enzyme required for sulfatase activity